MPFITNVQLSNAIFSENVPPEAFTADTGEEERYKVNSMYESYGSSMALHHTLLELCPNDWTCNQQNPYFETGLTVYG